ncbi:hypothetical protein [Falsiroseomonas sp.]|uniref:hypothetical protein n=1 Tax=Falsiroseomonas sp. TaxID=2870721 RepID=UPI003F6EB9A1
MHPIEINLADWKKCLVPNIPVAGLISRNPIVYKWKAPFRVWMLREVTFWRFHDLASQSFSLHNAGHGLGSRILLRSGLETLSVLIYLNQIIQRVIDGAISFSAFGETTSKLLLGSRDGSTHLAAVNILTVLEKCEKRYPGIAVMYGRMSESAHPNYEGMMAGYSSTNYSEYETVFANRWMELYGGTHLDALQMCMETFLHEYDEVWPPLIENFERWIEANDQTLERMSDG